jgi:hypothetical protein
VLIIGMPRSGTTLVEQIVSMHPEAGAGGELHFWNQRGAAWRLSGAAGNKTPFLAKASADYLSVLRAIAPKAERVTDKMPFNFLWAGLIHMAFPRATIIHCRRAAVDTALSIHQTHFHPSLAFPTGGTLATLRALAGAPARARRRRAGTGNGDRPIVMRAPQSRCKRVITKSPSVSLNSNANRISL